MGAGCQSMKAAVELVLDAPWLVLPSDLVERIAGVPAVAVRFGVRGRRTLEELTLALDRLEGVLGVEATDFLEDPA